MYCLAIADSPTRAEIERKEIQEKAYKLIDCLLVFRYFHGRINICSLSPEKLIQAFQGAILTGKIVDHLPEAKAGTVEAAVYDMCSKDKLRAYCDWVHLLQFRLIERLVTAYPQYSAGGSEWTQ